MKAPQRVDEPSSPRIRRWRANLRRGTRSRSRGVRRLRRRIRSRARCVRRMRLDVRLPLRVVALLLHRYDRPIYQDFSPLPTNSLTDCEGRVPSAIEQARCLPPQSMVKLFIFSGLIPKFQHSVKWLVTKGYVPSRGDPCGKSRPEGLRARLRTCGVAAWGS